MPIKKSVLAPVVAAIIIVIVAAIGYFGYRALSPPAGQLSHAYTPGLAPWLDPKQKDQNNAQPPPGGVNSTAAGSNNPSANGTAGGASQ